MEYFAPRQPSTNVHLTLVKTWVHALNLRMITSATAHKDSKEKLVKVRSSTRLTIGILDKIEVATIAIDEATITHFHRV